MLMVMVAVGMFWSIFFVDIVGDVYGPTAGGLMVLVPSVGCVALCLGLLTGLQPVHAPSFASGSSGCESGSGSVSGSVSGLAMNPMNSDFGVEATRAI